VNILLLTALGGYMVHAIATHWHQGPEPEEGESHLHRGMPFPVMPAMLFLACQILGTPALADRLLAPQALIAAAAVLVWLMFRQARKLSAEEAGDRSQFAYLAGGLLQTALLVLSCILAYDAGALGRSLFNPGWVILGLLAGHLVFGVSLCFSHRSLDSFKRILHYLADVRPLARFAGRAPRQVFACVDVSLMEEIIYRVAVQGALIALLGSPALAIALVAVIFSVVHRHFFYNHVVDSLEFLAFSLLLGAAYFWTESLILVVMIHTVRNFEIVYFDRAEHTLTDGKVAAARAKGLIPNGR